MFHTHRETQHKGNSLSSANKGLTGVLRHKWLGRGKGRESGGVITYTVRLSFRVTGTKSLRCDSQDLLLLLLLPHLFVRLLLLLLLLMLMMLSLISHLLVRLFIRLLLLLIPLILYQ
jgi:hypothetical protein